MPVILVTDVLVWLLVAATIGYAAYCRRHEHLAAPWRRVFSSRAAMMSLVVLLAYLAVGLADSLHFRSQLERKDPSAPVAYSNDVTSLLDLAVGGLRARSEKTYSAPFATRLYAKELTEVPGGKSVRDYPRLRHGGAHLKDEADHGSDVATRAFGALAVAFMCWVVLGWALRGFARRHAGVPWGAAYLAFGLLLAVAAPAFTLSGSYHVLGTDKVGQDVFYLSLKSIRTSLVIGTLTTLVMLPLGAAVGIMAGYFRGWVDDVIQYLYTTLNSIPGVLLIAASVLMMQVYIDTHPELFPTTAERADLRLLFLCIILGLTSWTGLARLLRGEALKLRELEYIQAAHAFGVSHARIIGRHILPNVMHIIIISLVMDFSGLVLAEAVLSYVGVGVDPSTTSFGTMINNARLEMAREPMVWWALAAAFWFMFVLVLVANLFADAVRDGFDPRVRVGGGGA
ncbi:MAG: ABC transporter permease [Burkholderiales bacterium]